MREMFEITMAGPAKNALGSEMLQFLLDRLTEADGRPVLLTGTGDAFSAGLDLKEVARLDRDQMLAFLRLLERSICALFLYPGPTVAAVNGHAIAGGCVMTLCCDRRVIARNPKIKMGLNEVALGVRFPPRTLAVVRSRIPRRHVEQVILGARLFDPESALRVGLVDEIADDVLSVARARLSALAAHPDDGYAITKHDLRGTAQDLCSDDALERWLQEAVTVWTSTSLKEKVAAMFARQPAKPTP